MISITLLAAHGKVLSRSIARATGLCVNIFRLFYGLSHCKTTIKRHSKEERKAQANTD